MEHAGTADSEMCSPDVKNMVRQALQTAYSIAVDHHGPEEISIEILARPIKKALGDVRRRERSHVRTKPGLNLEWQSLQGVQVASLFTNAIELLNQSNNAKTTFLRVEWLADKHLSGKLGSGLVTLQTQTNDSMPTNFHDNSVEAGKSSVLGET